MSKLVVKWKEELSKELGNDSSCLASVRQGGFQNASTLVGKKWSLRTSRDLTNGEAINLMSFDPNFRRPEVFCRYKGCSVTNFDPAVLKQFGSGKRDLYLCPNHRGELMRKVNEMCQKKGVILTPEQSGKTGTASDDLSDYIQVIPLLEKIYRESVKGRVLRVPPKVAQEAVLNVRNFLLITNAVLNPNPANLVVLLPVSRILIMILRDPVMSRNLLLLLRGVVNEILFFFGVVYNWVYLDMNPGAMIGAGVGGFAGMIGGAVFGPWGSAAGAAGGAAFGGLIGSGIYRLNNERAHVRRDFEFEGNARGDLNLIIW